MAFCEPFHGILLPQLDARLKIWLRVNLEEEIDDLLLLLVNFNSVLNVTELI